MKSSIRWELEPKCNLNCKHCIVGRIDYSTFQVNTLDTYFNIIDRIKELGITHICFSTKEPLLNQYFFEILEYCSSNNIWSSFITNGLLLNNSILFKLPTYKLKDIAISLEGWDEESVNKIRGKHFQRINKCLHDVNSFKNKNYQSVIQLNLTKDNIKKASSFFSYFEQFSGFVITVGNLSPIGNAEINKDICCSFKECFSFFLEIIKFKRNKLNNQYIFTFLPYSGTVFFNMVNKINQIPTLPSCSINNNGYTLYPNGDICRCIILDDPNCHIDFNNNLGNIISNSPINLDLDVKSKYKTNRHILCKDCINKKSCHICYALTSSHNEKDFIESCSTFNNILDKIIHLILGKKIKFSINKKILLESSNSKYYVHRIYDTGLIKKEVDKTTFDFLNSHFFDSSYMIYSEKLIDNDLLRLCVYNDFLKIKGVNYNELLSYYFT